MFLMVFDVILMEMLWDFRAACHFALGVITLSELERAAACSIFWAEDFEELSVITLNSILGVLLWSFFAASNISLGVITLSATEGSGDSQLVWAEDYVDLSVITLNSLLLVLLFNYFAATEFSLGVLTPKAKLFSALGPNLGRIFGLFCSIFCSFGILVKVGFISFVLVNLLDLGVRLHIWLHVRWLFPSWVVIFILFMK